MTGEDGAGDSGMTLAAEMAAVTRLWAQLRVADRGRYLARAAQAVIDEFDDLCLTIAAESARPCGEVAALELLAVVDVLRWMGEHAQTLLGAHRLAMARALHPLTRASAGHAPVGVVAIRSGAGSPFADPLTAAGAALLAGNGVILRPATGAAIAANRLIGVLARAGLPEGLVRTAASEERLIGADRVLDLAGGARGPDAMIVLADANLRRAVDGALWAACAGAGQLAGSLKRVYVAAERHEAFLEAVVAAASEIEPGDPLDAATQLGLLADAASATTLERAIAEAGAFGARVHGGGRRAVPNVAGVGFAPVVLSAVAAQARLVREPVAGPVLCVVSVSDSVEAARLANGAQPSLGASIWSADRRASVRVARELTARVVWGNDHVPVLPLRQAATDALEGCRRAQLITWEPAGRRPPWRFRYDASTQRAARAVAGLQATREGEREQELRRGAPALIRLAGRSLRR